MFGLAVSFVTLLLLGYVLQEAIVPMRSAGWPMRLFRAGLVLPLGVGASSWLYIVQRLLLVPSMVTVLAGDILAIACLAVIASLRRKRNSELYDHRAASEETGFRPSMAVLCALVVGTAVFFAIRYSAFNPSGHYDAWLQWNLKARFLFGGGGAIWPQLLSAPTPHPGYPFLLPCAVARAWTYAGTEIIVAPIALALVMTFGAAFLLFGAVTALRGPEIGMTAAMILLLTTAFVKLGTWQYADVPLALFVLGSVAVLSVHEKLQRNGRFGYLALTGLLLSFAVSTKDEGLLFAAVFLAVFAVVVLRNSPGLRLRYLVILTASVSPWLVLTGAQKVMVRESADIFDHQETISARIVQPARYALIAKYAAQTVLPPIPGRKKASLPIRVAGHPTVLLGLAVAVFGLRWKWPMVRIPLLTALLMTLGYATAYAITPRDLNWHLMTSVDRLAMHIWPVVIYAVCSQLRLPHRSQSPRQCPVFEVRA